jgi:hypothetical protein
MIARIASHAVFWSFMTVMTVASFVFVLLVYLPFVALKAVWLAVSGRLHETTGQRTETNQAT